MQEAKVEYRLANMDLPRVEAPTPPTTPRDEAWDDVVCCTTDGGEAGSQHLEDIDFLHEEHAYLVSLNVRYKNASAASKQRHAVRVAARSNRAKRPKERARVTFNELPATLNQLSVSQSEV